MSFAALSILLSASETALPDSHVEQIGLCLGTSHAVALSRIDCYSFMGSKRRQILADHSSQNPSTEIFSNMELLSRGSLLALARSHGIVDLGKTVTKEAIKVLITKHIATGACSSNESSVSHIACSSLLSQLQNAGLGEEYDCEDPNKLLQIQLLSQLCPILHLKALRRLLELHDISYVESDKKRHLRRLLNRYLHQLKSGKLPENEPHSTNLGGKQRRARERAQLQAAWPQVVPDGLKQKLLKMFNFEISAANLAAFVCGSCAEVCAVKLRTLLDFDEFELDLLKRPDHSCSSQNDTAMDIDLEGTRADTPSDNEDELFAKRTPYWLHPHCPEPPMPLENSANSSLLVDRIFFLPGIVPYLETPVAPFDWFTGRREWLRRFSALGFGEVDLIVEMRGFVLRLMCPENAVCSAAEVYYKQVTELRRIMDDDASQFETATGSSWFEIASNTMQLLPKDGSFLIRIASATKDDFNWMKTKLAVGQLLDVQVEFIRRDFQDETHTVLRRDYYLRVTEWDVAPSRWVLRKSSDYVCELADVRGCSKCAVDHKT
ncbi:hypothetical protein B0H11DRAFT_1904002 [Mycena galericulata]|nr:hypothetical protein B0H11DRAFT_1904002 [Mycena galericulata]